MFIIRAYVKPGIKKLKEHKKKPEILRIEGPTIYDLPSEPAPAALPVSEERPDLQEVIAEKKPDLQEVIPEKKNTPAPEAAMFPQNASAGPAPAADEAKASAAPVREAVDPALDAGPSPEDVRRAMEEREKMNETLRKMAEEEPDPEAQE